MAAVISAAQRLNLDAITNRVLPTPLELQQDLHALVSEVQQPADGNADDLIGALLVKILVGLQRYAAERLAGESAAAVILGIPTGDVLALASAPGHAKCIDFSTWRSPCPEGPG